MSALPIAAAPGTSLRTADTIINVVVAAGILLWLLAGQLRRRPVRTRLTFPVILILLGAGSVETALRAHVLPVAAMPVLLASLLLNGVGLAGTRAYTVHLWREGDVVWRRGTWLTALLWLVGVAGHVGLDALAGAGTSTYLLYFGLALLAQRLGMRLRVAHLPEPMRDAAGHLARRTE